MNGKPRIIMSVNLDLTPPRSGESKIAVLGRLGIAIEQIKMAMISSVFDSEPRFQADVGTYLDDMALFFEPDVPPELADIRQEWASRFHGPAA